jgi:hypothetical protein
MKEKNPLEHLLSQIGDMIKTIQEHKGPIADNMSADVLGRLDRLEEAVNLVDDLNKEALKGSDMNINRLANEFQFSPEVKEKDKQLLKRAKEIERDARSLQLQCAHIMNQTRGQASKVKNKDVEKQKMKERKKKFKPLGGNKGWIPL